MDNDNWYDLTNSLLDNVEDDIKTQFNIDIEDLLSNPSKYSDNDSIKSRFNDAVGYLNEYLDNVNSSLSESRLELESELSDIDKTTDSILNSIKDEASKSDKPVMSIDNTKYDDQSVIALYVSKADDNTKSLVKSLISNSLFIIDKTSTYNNKHLGEWLFIGNQKIFDLSLSLSSNPVISFDLSKGEINMLTDEAADTLGVNATDNTDNTSNNNPNANSNEDDNSSDTDANTESSEGTDDSNKIGWASASTTSERDQPENGKPKDSIQPEP